MDGHCDTDPPRVTPHPPTGFHGNVIMGTVALSADWSIGNGGAEPRRVNIVRDFIQFDKSRHILNLIRWLPLRYHGELLLLEGRTYI